MFLLYFMAAFIIQTASADREDLLRGIAQLNSDVLELRNEIEASISGRCDSIRGCYKSSYDECRSQYTTNQVCPSFEQLGYAIPECGSGKRCNGLFDSTITTVRMPNSIRNGKNGNPTNPEVVEAICYTRTAERWMVQKSQDDEDVWNNLGVSPPQMYFGSSTGVFRIFPARQSRECGQYDPRLRPWYQASVPSTISNSVKPRRVVIMMDTSRSMNETMSTKTRETKLSYMKKAVTSAISTLSKRASIAVIRFGEYPEMVGRPGSTQPFLWRQATTEHKNRLVKSVNAIEVKGRSNWPAAFNFAFRLIRNSIDHSDARNIHECDLENVALLFFSDGRYNMPAGVTDEEIVNTVSTNVERVETSGDYKMHTFLYSLGNTNKDQVEKQISCAVGGYWTPVNSNIAPGNVTIGYQSVFSTPMGTDAFYNYTSWSNPYTFATSGELGYTVSSLVYNRDVEPPRFMGAVGMDISAEAARQLYGGTMDETIAVMTEYLNTRKEEEFNTTCDQQRINLTYCETQSMRQLAGGNGAICLPKEVNISSEKLDDVLEVIDGDAGDVTVNTTDKNTTTVVIDETALTSTLNDDDVASQSNTTEIGGPTDDAVNSAIFDDILNCSKGFISPCAGYDEYPDDMWNNANFRGEKYADRVCCEVGGNSISANCPKLDEVRDTKISDAAIFGIMFASLAVAEIFFCYFCFYWRKRRNASI